MGQHAVLTRLKLDSPHQRIALLGLESYVHENKVEEATKTLQCLFLTTLIFVLSAFLAPLSFGSQSQVTAT